MLEVAEAAVVRPVAWDDPVAAALRAAMTAEVAPRYPDRAPGMPLPVGLAVDPATLVYTGVAFAADRAVGHVAVRRLDDSPAGADGDVPVLEIKRMFVEPSARGTGVGRLLLIAAEQAAWDAGARRVVLQTGDRQPDAVGLYERNGYRRIPVFAPYQPLAYALCFAKGLDRRPVA